MSVYSNIKQNKLTDRVSKTLIIHSFILINKNKLLQRHTDTNKKSIHILMWHQQWISHYLKLNEIKQNIILLARFPLK